MMLRFTRRIHESLRPFYLALARDQEVRGDAVLGVELDSPDARRILAEAITDAWLEALVLGSGSVLSADQRSLFNAMNSGSLPLIRSLAPELAAATLERLNLEVKGLIAEAMSQGLSGRDIASRIMESFDASRVDAERIARSEGIHAFNQGALEAMQVVGVLEYEWDAFPDADEGDPDGVCAVFDGKRFPVGGGPLPVRDTHPNCRCAIIGVVE